jgi:Uncharacterized stress-induced protein
MGTCMIRSMTAFATAERATEGGTLAAELRAVNHRFLELGVRLPDELRVLEPALRERVASRVSRGKLDLTLRLRLPKAKAHCSSTPASWHSCPNWRRTCPRGCRTCAPN